MKPTTTYQLIGDIFLHGEFQGREEIVITLPAGFDMSEHRATMVFTATVLNGAARNVHYSTLVDTGSTQVPRTEIINPFNTSPEPPAGGGDVEPTDAACTEGAPFHPGW